MNSTEIALFTVVTVIAVAVVATYVWKRRSTPPDSEEPADPTDPGVLSEVPFQANNPDTWYLMTPDHTGRPRGDYTPN